MAVLYQTWRIFSWLVFGAGALALVAGAMLAVPLTEPPELVSVHRGAIAIDRSGLPNLSHFQARDGTHLAYRFYPSADQGVPRIAILVHGSAGGSDTMNELAKALAARNIAVVTPDIRGHGASGTRGDIGYIGQIDDDLADLVAELRRQFPAAHFELLGFSAGGGFALRAASEKLAKTFDRLVLIAPYLGYAAASSRPSSNSARWADVDMPRIIALAILRRLGLPCCEALPVIAFAVAPNTQKFVTSRYSYRLLANFTAPHDINRSFRMLAAPTTIIAGAQDELMNADKYAEIVRGIAPAIDVRILPGLGHMDMLHAPAAIAAVLDAFKE